MDFLLPIADRTAAHIQILHHQALGHSIRIHSQQKGFPDLEGVHIAIVGIKENRRDLSYLLHQELDFNPIREELYSLFPGNWHLTIADLGDIEQGATVDDTYFAVNQLVQSLVKQEIIPVFLGGSHDLTYPIYRAFDKLDQMVNILNVDSRFDIGDSNKEIDHQSYIGKIIVDKPYNLFNYCNIGYQTYFNPQEEIDLLDRLHFDTIRLGDAVADISCVEPMMRDADIVTLDVAAIESSALGFLHTKEPNGFSGKEICAISRYAGISDKIKVFGIFEFCNNSRQDQGATMLLAQVVWYFIEGVNYRANESLALDQGNFKTYQVPINEDVLTFYKSMRTERWWIEIPFILGLNNKLKRRALLPCTYQDYLDACDQVIPERWYKARRKNEV